MRFQLLTTAVLAGLLAATPGARAEDLTIVLAVKDGGFDPAQIEAPAGARIKLEVANQTAAAIEFESFDFNRERVIQPGQKSTVYVSGLATGRYEFFDEFHPERRGVLLVK